MNTETPKSIQLANNFIQKYTPFEPIKSDDGKGIVVFYETIKTKDGKEVKVTRPEIKCTQIDFCKFLKEFAVAVMSETATRIHNAKTI